MVETISKYNHKDVFNFLCELVMDEEFKVAQGQFFIQNCQEFEEDEENKFIYTNIFEEYVKILDQVIDTKLLSKFPDLDLQDFFDQFKKNYKQYENQDVVDILFSFTDFLKFKENMLNYKKGVVNASIDEQGQTTLLGGDKDFQRFEKLLKDDMKLWKKMMEGKKDLPMIVYQRKVEGIPMDVARIEVNLIGVHYSGIIDLFENEDNDYIKQQARYIKDFRTVDRPNQFTKIGYMRSTMPIMTDRDFLVKTILTKRQNGATIFQCSVQREDVPVIKGVIRAEIFKGIILEQVGKDCKMTEISYADLKGYIPKMLLNIFISKTVSEEVKKLHKYLIDQQNKKGKQQQQPQQQQQKKK